MKPCLDCGSPSPRSRCPRCAYLNERGRRPNFRDRGYDVEYERNRKLILKANPTCAMCGGPATTADHIIPRSKGGGNGIGNLRPACQSCNSGRGNRPTTP